jgi:hypothetical protein
MCTIASNIQCEEQQPAEVLQSEVAGERRGDGPWVPTVSANEKEQKLGQLGQSAIDVTQCQSVQLEKDTRADSDTFSSGLPGSASDGDNETISWMCTKQWHT